MRRSRPRLAVAANQISRPPVREPESRAGACWSPRRSSWTRARSSPASCGPHRRAGRQPGAGLRRRPSRTRSRSRAGSPTPASRPTTPSSSWSTCSRPPPRTPAGAGRGHPGRARGGPAHRRARRHRQAHHHHPRHRPVDRAGHPGPDRGRRPRGRVRPGPHRCRYRASSTRPGQQFDSSSRPGEPSSFPIGVGGVVAGWDDRRYPQGTRLFGKVTNLTDYGAFVEIEAGIEGLVHVSGIDWTNKNVHPSQSRATGR